MFLANLQIFVKYFIQKTPCILSLQGVFKKTYTY